MRGRTNITGGGMNLNATLEDFVVEEGRSVVSGDFVEYKTQVSENTLISGSDISMYDYKVIGDKMFVTQTGQTLYLIATQDNGLEIVDACNDYLVADYEVLTDGSIVILSFYAPYIIRLRVEGNGFRYVCSVQNFPEGALSGVSQWYANEVGGKLFVTCVEIASASSSGGAKVKIGTYLFDVSQETSISYINGEKGYTPVSEWGNVQKSGASIHKPAFFGTYAYIYETMRYESYTSLRSRIRKFQINGNALELLSGGFDFGTAAPSFPQTPIMLHEKYLLFSSTSTLYVYNIKTDACRGYSVTSMGFPNYSTNADHRKVMFSLIGGGKIAIYYYAGNQSIGNYSNGILKIGEAVGDVSLISNIFEPNLSAFSSSAIGVVFLDGTIYDITGGKSYAVGFDEYTNTLSERINKSYVMPYSGGKAIGVAKQSGKSGQTIEVYVAKPSA